MQHMQSGQWASLTAIESCGKYLWEVSVPNSLPRSFDHVCDISHYLRSRLGQHFLLLLTQALVLVESLRSVRDPELERKHLLVPDQNSLAIFLLMDLDLDLTLRGLLRRVPVKCNHIMSKSLEPFLALGGVEGGGVHLRVRLVRLHGCGNEEAKYAVGGWRGADNRK